MKNHLSTLIGLIIGLGLVGGGVLAWVQLQEVEPTSQISAEAMPPETLLYASVDVLNLLDPIKLARAARALAPVYDQVALQASTEDEAVAAIDRQFAALDLSFRSDIQPWLGRSVGAGVLDFVIENDRFVPTRYVFSAEIRDIAAADAFLAKLVTNYPNAYAGRPLAEETYLGASVLAEAENAPFAIGRSGTLMLIANDAAMLRRAIDAQQGESLFDGSAYSATIAKLPTERPVTLFAAGTALDRSIVEFERAVGGIDLSDAMQLEASTRLQLLRADLSDRGFDALQGLGGTLDVGDEGFQIDFASAVDMTALSAENAPFFQRQPPEMQANQMPADTIAYVSATGLGNIWQRNRALILGVDNADDADDALQLAEQQFGFDLEADLLNQLTGNFAAGFYPDGGGLLAALNNTPLGMVLVQDVPNPDALAQPIAQLGDVLPSLLGVPVVPVDNHYSIAILGQELAAYGVIGDELRVVTRSEHLAQPADILTSSAEFQRALLAFSAEMTLTGWVDLNGLAPVVNNESFDLVQNLPMAAWAMHNDGSGGTARLILFFESQ